MGEGTEGRSVLRPAAQRWRRRQNGPGGQIVAVEVRFPSTYQKLAHVRGPHSLMKAERTSPSDTARIWSHRSHKGLRPLPGERDSLGSVLWHPNALVGQMQAQRHRHSVEGRPTWFLLPAPPRGGGHLHLATLWSGRHCRDERATETLQCHAGPLDGAWKATTGVQVVWPATRPSPMPRLARSGCLQPPLVTNRYARGCVL